MSEKINDGGAPFPHMPEVRQSVDSDLVMVTPGDQPGMTLRDYFAAKALPEFISLVPTEVWNQGQGLEGKNDNALMAAKAAYRMADAMLKARSS